MKLRVLVIACAFTVNLQAQKILLEFSGSHNMSIPLVKGEAVVNNSYEKRGIHPAYSIGVSGKINKWFYVKSEIGYASNYSDLNITFRNKQGNTVRLDEDYKSSSVYLAVLAEARGGNKFLFGYINLGVSYFSIVSGVFTSQINTGSQFNPGDFNGVKIGLIHNAGFGIKVKSIGLFTGYGYNYILPGKMKTELPAIGYLQFNFRIGVLYNLD
ncbi:MAG: hypothetical protein K2Q24_07865 [Chitinophagaceae bacterium]|jgi:hypothetical protein|nr:hypothetical protein [Chitinophagaceae bacterium]